MHTPTLKKLKLKSFDTSSSFITTACPRLHVTLLWACFTQIIGVPDALIYTQMYLMHKMCVYIYVCTFMYTNLSIYQMYKCACKLIVV